MNISLFKYLLKSFYMLWIINKFNKFSLFENSNKTSFSWITNIVPSVLCRITYTFEINKKPIAKCVALLFFMFLCWALTIFSQPRNNSTEKYSLVFSLLKHKYPMAKRINVNNCAAVKTSTFIRLAVKCRNSKTATKNKAKQS